MDVIYGLIPGMLILGLVGVAVFFWAARSGQFEDLEGEANRILMDDDLSQRKSHGKDENGSSTPDQGDQKASADSAAAVTGDPEEKTQEGEPSQGKGS
ncbi:MAG: cbb3-type cytochrome oxidase assembly protein CcoS [Sedimenticola sp.]|nr:cbb3-type cytochrome oxidase assembly protein CcoS [Sedimenticola sp.]